AGGKATPEKRKPTICAPRSRSPSAKLTAAPSCSASSELAETTKLAFRDPALQLQPHVYALSSIGVELGPGDSNVHPPRPWTRSGSPIVPSASQRRLRDVMYSLHVLCSELLRSFRGDPLGRRRLPFE